MSDLMITTTSAPALGDVRALGRGDTLWLAPDANTRKDFGRYQDAITSAVSHGANVVWMSPEPVRETMEEKARREYRETR